MFSLSRIVVPVAFSERCGGACRYAASIARRFRSELKVIHVEPPLDHGFGFDATPVTTELARIRREWSEREIQKLLDGHGFNLRVNTVILEGDPAREIVGFSRRQLADVIIIPTHGYPPFRRFLVGSVTARVLHESSCPVLTGSHMEETPHPDLVPLRTVACAVDLGGQTRQVLSWAATFASRCLGELSILHVAADAEGVRDATARLGEMQRQLGIGGRMLIASGPVLPTLGDMEDQLGADLLIIGRGHGRTASSRLPSKTYALVRTSRCPVVSV